MKRYKYTIHIAKDGKRLSTMYRHKTADFIALLVTYIQQPGITIIVSREPKS